MTLPANRSMPASAVIPVLHYADVAAATDWLQRAFQFTVRLRIGDHRAQLNCCGGHVVVAQLLPEAGETLTLPQHSVMVRVGDADAHYAHAVEGGAAILSQPTSYPYGERQYTARDPGGHIWTFSQSIADVDPAGWGGLLLA
jgi:uncharacterized glyoxalase superfamily protein PhnB